MSSRSEYASQAWIDPRGCESVQFLFTEAGVKLIDCERSYESTDLGLTKNELQALQEELSENSGRGGGFI